MVEIILLTNPQQSYLLPGRWENVTVSLKGIDWAREVAMVIDMGEQRTGGYGVEVANVEFAAADEVHLGVKVCAPAPGQFVAQVLTRPYAVCRLPRAGFRPGPVTIILRDQMGIELAKQVIQL